MMLCNIPVRRTALREWPAHDPTRETFVFVLGRLVGEARRRRPKEQPPRKLSGKRTAIGWWTSGKRGYQNSLHRRGNPAPPP